ncbi:S8 family serine peptidase [Streptomyces sp. NRRL F-2747]|uniref:S8 family serine peptidase n=1 Tax=Streptomyces sp. NRRL F-2747 TaxID=1463843 RepID=UPI0004C7959A|nr:S8 family serine peptidase [Streptomyces sp. NRRL F-2747]
MRPRRTTSALVGLVLAGVAAAPAAHADTARPEQWHLDAMRARDIWKLGTGQGVTVAVIDTGVARIPELDGQVVRGKDFSHGYEGDERTDYGDHGTGIATLIAGTGKRPSGGGAFGLAPGAKILPLRVSEGGGNLRLHQSIAEAIRFAADSEARVLNISFGGPGRSAELDAAVRYAVDHGKLVFSSVGNDGDGPNEVMYPSGSPGVVGVSAVGPDGAATQESQHGPQVDLAAPGVDIATGCADEAETGAESGSGAESDTTPDPDPDPDSAPAPGLCVSHGTSDATALVSASAALLWSAHPDWTGNQILRVLLNTAEKPDPVHGIRRNDRLGQGVVSPVIALTSPGDPGPADVYPLPDLAAADGLPSPAAGRSGPVPAPEPASHVQNTTGNDRLLPWAVLGMGTCLLVAGAVTTCAHQRVRG